MTVTVNGNSVTIDNFNLNSEQNSQGFLNIGLPDALTESTSTSSSESAYANPQNQNVSANGTTQSVTFSTYDPSDSPQTVTVDIAGGNASDYSANTGASVLSFVNGSISLVIPAGQTSVTIGLVYSGTETTVPPVTLTSSQLTSSGAIKSNNSITVNYSGASVAPTATTILGQQIFYNPNAVAPNPQYYIQQGSQEIAVTNAAGLSGATTLYYGLDNNNDIVNTTGTVNDVFNPNANGNDTISGGNNQNVIIVGSGNDQIYGGSVVSQSTALNQRATAVAAGGKGDFIGVGNGNNTIVGSNGNDAINLGTGNNIIYCGAGADSVIAGVETSSASLNWSVSAPQSFDGFSNVNVYSNVSYTSAPFSAANGYEGAFIVTGPGTETPVGFGNDTIFGGKGNSSYWLANGNNYLDAGGGNDFIQASTGNDTIFGGIGTDTIFSGGGNNYIDGESGNDAIVGQGGNVTIDGGTGNDTIYSGDSTTAWATSQTGTGDLISGSGNVALFGAGGSDTLSGGSGNDTLFAGAGSEYLQGGSGHNTLFGGAGNDTIICGNAGDSVNGGSGSATITGGTGVDTIFGGTGATVINAGDGGTDSAAIQISAGSGHTTIYGGAGIDNISGGANTTLIYTGNGGDDTTATQVIAGSGVATIYGGTGVDHIEGGAGTDVLNAGNGGDTKSATVIQGGTGTTTINGGTGVDQLFAGAGNTTINGGSGVDYIQGGSSGVDVLNAGSGGTSTMATEVIGGAATTSIYGGSGVDDLKAGSGGTIIYGGTGIDQIYGGSGVDSLIAGAGQTTITAGSGSDTMVATQGSDVFVGGVGKSTYVVGNNDGTVNINNSGGSDVLDLTGGITEANIQVSQSTNSTGNVITITTNNGSTVEINAGLLTSVEFTDGATATLSQLLAPSYTVGSTTYSSISATAGTGITALEMTGTGNVTATANNLNDTLISNSGNDTLIAGSGNDTLVGGAGTTTYVVDAQSPSTMTTINGSGASDTLVFGAGISAASVVASATNSASSIDVELRLGELGVVVVNNSNINQFVFADGTSLTLNELLTQTFTDGNAMYSSNNATLSGGATSLILTGLAGITGTAGATNDIIIANSGNDTLYAGAGNDTLVAGATGSGQESLIGGNTNGDGTTTYLVDASTGTTTISAGTSDILQIGSTVDLGTLVVTQTTGQLTFSASNLASVSVNNTIGYIELPGELVLSMSVYLAGGVNYSNVSATVQGGATNLYLTGTGNLTATGNNLNDEIVANSGNDSLIAGTGNDTLVAGPGNDTLLAGAGNETFQGSTGQTTYQYNQEPAGPSPSTITINDSGANDVLVFGSGIKENFITASSSLVNGVTVGNLSLVENGTTVSNVVINGGTLNQFQFADGLTVSLADLIAQSHTQGDSLYSWANATLPGSLNVLTLVGSANLTGTLNNNNNDSLNANSGNDLLIAGTGTDTLSAGSGSDTLVAASAGSQYLVGGNANGDGTTTYVVGPTTGYVTVNAGTNDILKLTSSVNLVGLTINQTTPYLSFGSSNLNNVSVYGSPASIELPDGTLISLATFETLSFADTASATQFSSTSSTVPGGMTTLIQTGSANINATANTLNDTIYANSGNDSLLSGSGHDTLIAGYGNDTLIGGAGVTTYQINVDPNSQGSPRITTINASAASDLLQLGAGLSAGNVTATSTTTSGQTVTTLTIEGGDTVVINGSLSNVKFSDGTTLTLSQLIAQNFVDGNTMYSNTSATLASGLTGLVLTGTSNLSATANSGNDTLVANSGVDTLNGGAGNDTFEITNPGDVINANGTGTNTEIVTEPSNGRFYNVTIANNVQSLIAYNNVSNLTMNLNGDNRNEFIDVATGAAFITAGSGQDTLEMDRGPGTGSNITTGTGKDTVNAYTSWINVVINNSSDVVQTNSSTSYLTEDTYVSFTATQGALQITSHTPSITITGQQNMLVFGAAGDTLIAATGDTIRAGGAETLEDALGAHGIEFEVTSTDVINVTATGTGDWEYAESSLTLANNIQNVTGAAGVSITSNSLNDTINSGGNDTLIAGSGADLLYGAGGDTFVVNSAQDTIRATGTGNTEETYYSTTLVSGVQSLIGMGAANLTLTGYVANFVADTIAANAGNDTLIAGGGLTTMIGGSGNDVMIGNAAQNSTVSSIYQVNYGNGTQTIEASTVNDVLSFGANIDAASLGATQTTGTVNGVTGQPIVTIQTTGGTTVVLDNPQFSQIECADGSSTTIANLLAENSTTTYSSVTTTMAASTTRLILTGTGNISATGNTLSDVMIANSGNDTLTGGIGLTTLIGGAGTDSLVAGSGVTTLVGGTGNTTFVVNNTADSINELANSGNNTEQTTVSMTLAANVQNLVATGTSSLSLSGNTVNSGVITANNASDTLTAGSWNDTLVSGTGVDSLVGGTGSDTFIINNAADVVTETNNSYGSMEETPFSTILAANVGNLTGLGSANITLTGNSTFNVITANSGADTLVAGSGATTLIGGSGNDTFVVNSSANVIREAANTGNNTEQASFSTTLVANVQNLTGFGSSGITLTGNSLNNVITANNAADKLVAGSGTDTLVSGTGIDSLNGGSGNDTFVVNNASDVISKASNTGNNTEQTSVSITLAANVQSLVAITGSTALTLTGNSIANTITANNGADTLIAGSGLTTLIGGTGNDVFEINNVGDVISKAVNTGTNTEQSTVSTTLAANVQNLTGTGAGNITLTGNNLANTITANTGADTLVAGAGLATLVGGTGNDIFVIDNASDVITKATNTGSNTEQSSVSITLAANVQNLTGNGSGSITLTGNTLANKITANTGNDTLIAGTGVATLIGGTGNDNFVVDNASDVITEAVNTGNNTEQTNASVTLAANVQNLVGTGTTALTLTGNSIANTITANSAADTLIAGSGLSTLIGGSGNDVFEINNVSDVISKATNTGSNTEQSTVSTILAANVQNLTGTGTGSITLTGNNLANTITANTGTDTLVAGTGLATLVGGTGNDTFVIDNASDVITKATNTGSNTEQSSVSITLAGNVQNLTGTGTANIALTGNTLANKITANTGNDTLTAGTGVATLIGGTGNDTFVVDNTTDVITEAANTGNNSEQTNVSVTLAANVQNLVGTGTTTLTLTGSSIANTITANSAADTLIAGSGLTTLIGGTGNDVFEINNVGDVISKATNTGSNTEQSTVSTTLAANVQNLTGTGSSNITLTGNNLTNSITANAGTDTLVAGTGLATLVGGTGNDTFVIDNASDVITKATNTGSNTEQSSVSIALASNVQNLTGTGTANISLTGNTLANNITANTGNDTLIAGTGVATLIGGTGNDTFMVDNASDVITEAANAGDNIEQTSVSIALATNVQNLTGTGSAALTLTGNTGNDVITGNSGADSIVGGSGVDVMIAGSGATTMKDTVGDNVMLAGSGNATMTGGTGTSFISGGKGTNAITLGAGKTVVAFNTGDGAATIAPGSKLTNTLSLGGGIAYANLTFTKSGNNLILNTGGTNAITFSNWYSASADQNFTTLQVIEQAAATYSSTSSNVLYNNEVEEFNFTQLVAAFTTAGSPANWSLAGSLTAARTSGSNTAAIGGDLGYYDGLNGNLNGMNLTTAATTLQSASYQSSTQAIDAWASINTGVNPLAKTAVTSLASNASSTATMVLATSISTVPRNGESIRPVPHSVSDIGSDLEMNIIKSSTSDASNAGINLGYQNLEMNDALEMSRYPNQLTSIWGIERFESNEKTAPVIKQAKSSVAHLAVDNSLNQLVSAMGSFSVVPSAELSLIRDKEMHIYTPQLAAIR